MKIHSYLNKLTEYDSRKVEAQRVGAKNGPKDQTLQKSGDHVSLSDEGRLRALAMQSAGEISEVQTEKVQRLKDQVQTGTYAPDTRQTALKFLQEEFDLAALTYGGDDRK